jgi:hypothetical protein
MIKPLFKGLRYCEAGCSVHSCMHNLDLMGVSGFTHECQCKTRVRFVLERVTMA